MSSETRWHAHYMEMASLVASKSKDQSMQVGTVLVSPMNTIVSTGYNGFPRGIDEEEYHPERHEPPEKYFWAEHAERNAVYNAALNGFKTHHAIAYSTSHPCVDCARALIQAGVRELYIPTKDNDPFFVQGRWDYWGDKFVKALELLKAAGVKVTHVV